MKPAEFVQQYMDAMICDISNLVAIDTVLDSSTAGPQKPFGEGPAKGLTAFLKLAENMGMKTRNFEGYAGDVTIGEGSKMIGLLAHVDVVSAGEGWRTPPFQSVVKEGRLYGRGSSDDKGPLISSLYAMKYIKDNSLLPEGYSIRLIVGADEEEGQRCIAYYLEHAERLPDCGFVPDGYFPLVNCEKGLIDFDMDYTSHLNEQAPIQVMELTGGVGRNIVSPKATCTLKIAPEVKQHVLEQLSRNEAFHVEETADGCVVRTVGVATHAMSPEKGVSAINLLLHGLAQSGLVFSCQDFLESYDRIIGLDYNGKGLDCQWEDEESGVLTLNVGTIEMKGNTLDMKANVRFPVSYTLDTVSEHFTTKLGEAGFSYHEVLPIGPLFIPKDSTLITSLMEAYQQESGDMENGPCAIGGATYARYLPNFVSFGPLFPYEIELAHEANEYLLLDSLWKMTCIYIVALKKLLEES